MKISLTYFMAGWEHKERHWSIVGGNLVFLEIDHIRCMRWHFLDHTLIREYMAVVIRYIQFKFLSQFTERLDWQCEEGWEVFKISRD